MKKFYNLLARPQIHATQDSIYLAALLQTDNVTAPAMNEVHNHEFIVLLQPRTTRPNMTEKLMTGSKESNQTNKTTNL